MTYLSIDPGRSGKNEHTIGYAVFSGMGIYQERGRLDYGGLTLMMEQLAHMERIQTYSGEYDVYVVLCENFVNNPKSRGGQTNGTSECIGMVEFACYLGGVQFIRRPPAALGPAKLHAPKGSFAPLAHLRHEDSAFLHGHEYLIETGVLTVPGISSTI